ncbi:MAG: hypothetical protein ABSA39_19060 [Edaphobacter sp.]
MAGKRRGETGVLLFEGVVIPSRTRSAKIAAQGIADEEDLGRFLTAVFSETLSGKIVLPEPGSRAGVFSKKLSGKEHKLRSGLPVAIQSKELKIKRPRKTKPN